MKKWYKYKLSLWLVRLSGCPQVARLGPGVITEFEPPHKVCVVQPRKAPGSCQYCTKTSTARCFIMFHHVSCSILLTLTVLLVGYSWYQSALAVATKDRSAQCGDGTKPAWTWGRCFWAVMTAACWVFPLVLSLLVYFPRFVMKHVGIPPDQFLKSLRFFSIQALRTSWFWETNHLAEFISFSMLTVSLVRDGVL